MGLRRVQSFFGLRALGLSRVWQDSEKLGTRIGFGTSIRLGFRV